MSVKRPNRRWAGLLAAGTIAASTAVLGVSGLAQAEPTPLSGICLPETPVDETPAPTTTAPAPTTEAPASTTAAPTTTEAPSSTSEAPSSTSEAPSSTSEAPSSSSEAPSSTSEAPSSSSEAPSSSPSPEEPGIPGEQSVLVAGTDAAAAARTALADCAPETPGSETPETPGTGTPETPGTGTPETPGTGAPTTPSTPTTPVNPAPEAPDAGQLGAVRNLAAAVRTSSILVSWEPPADTTGIAGYQAFALPGAEPQSSAGMISCITTADVRSCLIGVTAGQQYTVGVLAFDSEGNIGATDAWVVTDVVPAAAPTASVPAGNASLEGPSGPITTVTAGQKLTLVGKGYLPFSTVTLVVYSEPRVLGTVEADVNGEFTTEVTIPADLVDGEHSLVASGVDAYGNPYVLRTDFTVGSGVAAAAGGSTGGAALASTGASIAIPLIGGLVAVGVGGGLVVASRRRKTTV